MKRGYSSKFQNAIESTIIAVAVVFIWWGIWGLLDLYLFPNNFIFKHVLAIVLGFIILLLSKRSLGEII